MTFTGRLRKLKRDVPNMTDAELLAAANDLNRTAVVLYYGAPDRVLNLCNEVLDAVQKEQARRRENLPPCASPCGDGTGGETKKEKPNMKKKPTAKKPTAAKVAAKPAKKTATAKKPAKVAKKPAKK